MEVSSREDILKFSRLLFIVCVFLITAYAAIIVFHPTSSMMHQVDYTERKYQLGLTFYARAFLLILFGCIPKIFGLSIIFSLMLVALVFIYKNKISNGLKGFEYLSSFIYFIKEFSALGLLLSSVTLLFMFLINILSIYFFIN